MNIELFKKYIQENDIILLGKERYRIFGITSYGLKKEIMDEVPDVLKDRNPLASINSNKVMQFYNVEDTISKEKIMFIIMHEILHLLLHHLNRLTTFDPVIFNIAADHVVNRELLELCETSNILEPIEGIHFFPEIEEQYPKASVEFVYQLLTENSNKQEEDPPEENNEDSENEENSETDSNDQGDDESDENESENDDGEEETEESSEEQSGESQSKNKDYEITVKDVDETNKIIEVKNLKTGKVTESLNDTCSQQATNENNNIEEIFQNAQLFWNSGFLKGDLPGNLTQLLTNIFKVEIPWTDVLKNTLLYNVQAKRKRSWMEPNFYIRGCKVPGTISKSKDPKILISVIDTSMSITDEIISKFAGVVVDSLDFYHGLYILQHDTKITKETFFDKRPNKQTVIDDIMNVAGRGGTSHKEIFNKIEELVQEKDISSIVFLTDYYSDVEYIFNDYNWIKQYETIWIVNSELPVKLKDCRTKTIRIQ